MEDTLAGDQAATLVLKVRDREEVTGGHHSPITVLARGARGEGEHLAAVAGQGGHPGECFLAKN